MIFLRINLTKHRTSVTSLIFDVICICLFKRKRMLWTYFTNTGLRYSKLADEPHYQLSVLRAEFIQFSAVRAIVYLVYLVTQHCK